MGCIQWFFVSSEVMLILAALAAGPAMFLFTVGILFIAIVLVWNCFTNSSFWSDRKIRRLAKRWNLEGQKSLEPYWAKPGYVKEEFDYEETFRFARVAVPIALIAILAQFGIRVWLLFFG